MNNIDTIERAINAAIQTYLNRGKRLITNHLIDKGKGCCALGAVNSIYDFGDINDFEKNFSEFLGFDFTSDHFWSFTDGFDGIGGHKKIGKNNALYYLGQKIRRKYIQE